MMTDILEHLGVEVVNVGEREIKGLCPVHHLVKGRPDTRPSWYMNAETGAWICFSCNQRGSLPYLIELLGADPEVIGRIPIEAMKRSVERWGKSGEEEEKPVGPIVSIETFEAESVRPPIRMCDRRDFDQDDADIFMLRWSNGGKCWYIPVFSIDGTFLGWQEKSKGYFNNTPDGMLKSLSLFGYHQVIGSRACVVESPLDVVRMRAYGIPAVATYGSYVSDDQINALVRRFSSVTLAMDNDEAGWIASDIIAKKIAKTDTLPDITYFVYGDARGKDPGDLTPAELLRGYEQATHFPPKEIRDVTRRAEGDTGRSRSTQGRRARRGKGAHHRRPQRPVR